VAWCCLELLLDTELEFKVGRDYHVPGFDYEEEWMSVHCLNDDTELFTAFADDLVRKRAIPNHCYPIGR
jgi:hypothetical protein